MNLWFRRRRIRAVVLYGKPGCHLCDDARALLEQLGGRYPMDVCDVDITGDPALFRRYDIRIPVIAVDGKREIEAPIDVRKLRQALK